MTVGSYDPFDGVWLRLSNAEPGTCRIAAQPSAVTSGLATPAVPIRSPAVAEGASLAYFALRPHTGTHNNGGRRFELGAIGHGNGDLASRITVHRPLQRVQRHRWHQMHIRFPDWHSAERLAVAQLGPTLAEAETAGLLDCWFFIARRANPTG